MERGYASDRMSPKLARLTTPWQPGVLALIGMTQGGATQYATIFEMTMVIPFAAVPVSSALACVQLVLMGVRDFCAAGMTADFVEDAR